MVIYMALCQLDGKIYVDPILHKIVLKNNNKELECECCSHCWGLFNIKYQLGRNNNTFIIPEDQVIKVYKISSNNFEYKPQKDKPESRIITDILKTMKDINKKKSKTDLQ